MSGNTKVLTGLMERRELEAQFAALAEGTNPEEVTRQAEAIAAHGSAALTLLLARLDTEDPQVRGGLGQVAKRLERDQTVAALRGVARSRDHSEQARLGALTILNRYLDEPIDESLVAGIQDLDGAAVRSLRELIQAMDRDPSSIIEYLSQLAEQSPEVAAMILDAVSRMSPHPHLVTLLRMFAQGESRSLARSAIEQLGRTRSGEAWLALDALTNVLPPDLGALAERNQRKLRLRGVRQPEEETGDAGQRVLLSPVDGSGAQSVWFINRSSTHDLSTAVTVIVHDEDGIIACFGANQVVSDELPPAAPLGAVLALPQKEGAPPLQLLETTPTTGCRAVRRALERHWKTNTAPPLAFRLLNPLIWTGEQRNAEAVLPERGSYSAAQTAALLDHPAFASWFWRDDSLLDRAHQLVPGQTLPARGKLIAALASARAVPAVIASYRRRLEAMADWLLEAGQPDAAALAMSAADHLAGAAPGTSPFVRRLIGMALDVAAVTLQAKPI